MHMSSMLCLNTMGSAVLQDTARNFHEIAPMLTCTICRCFRRWKSGTGSRDRKIKSGLYPGLLQWLWSPLLGKVVLGYEVSQHGSS